MLKSNEQCDVLWGEDFGNWLNDRCVTLKNECVPWKGRLQKTSLFLVTQEKGSLAEPGRKPSQNSGSIISLILDLPQKLWEISLAFVSHLAWKNWDVIWHISWHLLTFLEKFQKILSYCLFKNQLYSLSSYTVSSHV